MSTCDFEGCDRPARGKGKCAAHYQQLRRYGPSALRPIKSAEPMTRLTLRIETSAYKRLSTSARKARVSVYALAASLLTNAARNA